MTRIDLTDASSFEQSSWLNRFRLSGAVVGLVILCLVFQPLAFGSAVTASEPVSKTTSQGADVHPTTESISPGKIVVGAGGDELQNQNENVTEDAQNETGAESTEPSLSIDLYTTRGDRLAGPQPLNLRYHAQGQDVRVVIEYNGLPSSGGTIAVVDSDLLFDDEFKRVSVSGSSGTRTVDLSYEEVAQADTGSGADIEAHWVRGGEVEKKSNQVVVAEADTTMYISNYPDSVPMDESATVEVYGWSQYDFVVGELHWNCGILCDEVIGTNTDIRATPEFEDTISFTPSDEDVSVGQTLSIYATGSKDFAASSFEVDIEVIGEQNEQPDASFTASPNPATVGETVSFDGSGSADQDGSITGYEWDFDDDGTVDATGETVTHSFDAPGDYTVSLTVTDDDGATDTETRVISVSSDNDITATRTIARDEAQAGANVTVTIDVELNSKSAIQIIDNFDPALTAQIIDGLSNLDNVGDERVTFNSPTGAESQYTVAYEVAIPENATLGTTYEFNGNIVTSTDATIHGDNIITVRDVAWYDPYVNENGVVESEGLNAAISDYLRDELTQNQLNDIIQSYLLGEPIDSG